MDDGRGAVMALDVGHGQLDWRLRNDERVIVVEDFNARELSPDLFDLHPDLVTVDVSFISLTKVLPALVSVLTTEPGHACPEMVLLVKPQFEAPRSDADRGSGVITDPEVQAAAVARVGECAVRHGLEVAGGTASRTPGRRGNVEYFLHLRRPASF